MVAPGLATTAAPTEIRLCGRFAVCVEGERVDSALPARQGRLLLAYLLLNRRRPVPRDELVAALWPGDQPAGDLAPPLSRLRKALGPGRLEGRNDLALVLPDDAWIDWEAAHADLASVRAAVQSGDHAAVLEPAGRVALTAEAGLLPGLDAQWIDERRRELADMRVEALEAAAVAGTALGGARLPAAERAARQAVEAAPFHESAYAALMEVLRARGNVAEGLRAYEDLRVLLREELGTVPGPRVTALHERLLRAESEPEPERAPVRAPVAAGAGRPSRPRHEIVERDRELAELVRLADAAEAGSGRVALIEGPAGIGKSRLLTELRLHAESRGTPVLTAHGSVLEREFPFGLVRQLFEGRLAEPGARERLLSGAAAAAAPVFGVPAEAEDNQGDAARFASLNGLMWLTLNLAADGPLVLALDDLQWADVPSLRFVAYLARRLEGAPLLVAATLRSREEPTEPALVAEIAQAAAAAPIHPRPLTGPAVEAIVAERLGADPDPAFAAACHRATGGNPLLLQELLTALRADGVAPESASVELVRDIGPRAVSRGVLLRLARLPDDAIAVARAIAVLGENAAVPAIADLADIDETAVAAASDALTRAEILREEAPIAFAHPLLQDVVYRELAPAARELAHRRAARALGRLGASAEQISSHLLATSPRADEWSAETLREAGATARRRGAPESAIAYLRRALDETPAGDLRPWLLLELGVVEAELDAASAAGHLRAAREGLPDPRARSMAAFRWGYIETVAGDSDAAAALMRTAAAELDGATDPALVDLRQRLTALELYSCWFGSTDSTAHGRLEAHDYGREDDSAGGQMLLAVEAFNRACRGESAERVAAVARAAVTGAVLGGVEYEIRDVMAFLSLSAADSPEADALLERIIADSHRRGSRFSAASARMWHGELMIRRGELQDAIAECRAAIDDFGEWSRRMTPLRLSAYLATALTERGEHADAHAVIDRCTDLGRGQSGTLVTVARARLALAEGDAAGAIAAADTAAARCGTQVVNPAIAPWRSLKAQALDRLGDTQAALELAHEELTLARRWGAPAEIGQALRVLGTLERSEGIDRLREAVDVLTGSRARLELAKALAALGGALRRDRRPSEAREPLRMALELADACGAMPLAAHVRTELHATGARPRTEALSGVGALTASERRVVDLAVEGHTNRDIAQSLFVTPKTVEVHLTNVYRKLGISSRRDLAGAVAAG